jgi:hypothetical protein
MGMNIKKLNLQMKYKIISIKLFSIIHYIFFGEDYITRSFMICTPHQMLFG